MHINTDLTWREAGQISSRPLSASYIIPSLPIEFHLTITNHNSFIHKYMYMYSKAFTISCLNLPTNVGLCSLHATLFSVRKSHL